VYNVHTHTHTLRVVAIIVLNQHPVSTGVHWGWLMDPYEV